MRTLQPKVTYQIVAATSSGRPIDRRTYPTEEEARATLGAMRDKDPASARSLEVERVEEYSRGTRYLWKREGEWHDAHLLGQGKSLSEVRAQEARWAAEKARGPRTFVATFSGRHYHPDTGQNLRYAKLTFEAATQDDAFDLLWVAFGDDGWIHASPIDEKEEANLWTPPHYRIGWPKLASPPGETVTMRVRITEAQARQSELWVAGRCLLHRPAEDCTVLVGVGVMPEDGSLWQDAWSNGQGAGINGEGMILFVSCVRRADAERAAAADPENVSIVDGSESCGAYRCKPKVMKDEPDGPLAPRRNRVVVSGVFTLDALEAIAGAERAFDAVYGEAIQAWEGLSEGDRARVHGVEVVENRVVGIYVEPGRG